MAEDWKSKYDKVGYFREGLAKVVLNGQWGFVNTEGTVVIPLKYDWVGEYFIEGLAKVKLDYQWGFINEQGDEVVPLEYEEVEYFREGLASVRLNDKWGLINKQGTVVIPLKYDEIGSSFFKGLASVQLEEWGVIKYGFVDQQGQEYWD